MFGFDSEYTLSDGRTLRLNGEGHFCEDGDYAADCLLDGKRASAYYATSEQYDYYSDSREDCIDWGKPYLVSARDDDGTLYEADYDSCAQR